MLERMNNSHVSINGILQDLGSQQKGLLLHPSSFYLVMPAMQNKIKQKSFQYFSEPMTKIGN